MRVLIGIACGAGVGLGACLFLIGVRRQPRGQTRRLLGWHLGEGTRVSGSQPGGRPVRLASALAAAAVAGLITRWPVAGIAAAAAVWAMPASLQNSARHRARQVARLEALATWTESLAATLSAAAGLEQAIVVTCRTAPPALAEPLTRLGQAIDAGIRLPAALRAFAADAGDAGDTAADTVVAALLLAATHGGASLREPLTLLAAATRDDVAARRLAETSRARVATDTRLVLAVAAAMVTGLIVFNRGFLTPYDTLTGQLVLAVVIGIAAAAITGLYRLSRHTGPPRVIALTPTPPGPAAGSQ